MKHLLPLNPFIHRHFRYIGGGEEVFLQNPQKKVSFPQGLRDKNAWLQSFK